MKRTIILLSLALLCVTVPCSQAAHLYRPPPSYEGLRRQWHAIDQLKEKLAGGDFERVLAAQVRAIYDAYETSDKEEGGDVGAAQQQRQAEDQYAPDMLINLAMALAPERKAPLETLLVTFITDEKEDWSLRWLAAGIGAHFNLRRATSAAERICADDAGDENMRRGFLYRMFAYSDGAGDGFFEKVTKGEATQNQKLIERANELIGNVAKAKKLRRANPEELLQTWLRLIGTGNGELIFRLYERPCYWPEERFDEEESGAIAKWHKMHEVQNILRSHLESRIKWVDPWGREWIEIYDTAACRIGEWEVVIRKEHGLWYLWRVTLTTSMGNVFDRAP